MRRRRRCYVYQEEGGEKAIEGEVQKERGKGGGVIWRGIMQRGIMQRVVKLVWVERNLGWIVVLDLASLVWTTLIGRNDCMGGRFLCQK
jgi:hypothetical protein